MEEFKNFLINAVREEQEDRQKYKAWAEKAKSLGLPMAEKYLKEIAYDELTHKEALERILHMM